MLEPQTTASVLSQTQQSTLAWSRVSPTLLYPLRILHEITATVREAAASRTKGTLL